MSTAAAKPADIQNISGLALELLSHYGAARRAVIEGSSILRWIERHLKAGVQSSDTISGIDVHRAIDAGLPGHALPILQLALGLTKEEFSVFLGRSRKTLGELVHRKHLSRGDSDLLYRLARALIYSVSVFEDANYAVQWLKESNEALGGAQPLSLLATVEGNEIVQTELGAVEYGLPV